jgi:ABC-2 type transport system ATP-binding protein
MAQKLQFITTVLHRPKLLILDEPFSGFDPVNAELVRTEILRLRNEGVTVMLSTHNMGSVEELCDDIGLIHKAHLVLHGRVADIRRTYATNTYRVQYRGTGVAFANALGFTAELLDQAEHEGTITARVKLAPAVKLNDVLRHLLPGVEILGVQEEIPRMHDIFIRAVSEQAPDGITADMTE